MNIITCTSPNPPKLTQLPAIQRGLVVVSQTPNQLLHLGYGDTAVQSKSVFTVMQLVNK